MNQILSMQQTSGQDTKKKSQINYGRPSNKANIVSIARFFSILIIIFGIALVCDATYGIIGATPTLKDQVEVTANAIGTEVTIRAVGNMPIQSLKYRWGQGEETNVSGNGTVELETKAQIPVGNNILNIEVIDYYGNKSEYQKQYINEQDENSKPTIEISVSGNMLNITATDETEMSYISYSWNNETPTRIDMDTQSENKKELKASIEVLKGQNTLSIVAVDTDGNSSSRTENIKGANKPTFTIEANGTNIVINAKDEEGISKVSITVDGVTSEEEVDNLKELTATQSITPGEHTVTIKITNINGLSEEQSYTVRL